MIAYAPLSGAYRVFISIVIVLWVVMTPLLHPQPDKTVPPPADIAEAESRFGVPVTTV